MRKELMRLCALLLALCWLGTSAQAAPLEAEPSVELTSPSAMLLEAETGTVIFEKNADERRQAASVTKLMTLLICFEELEAGTIHLDDPVTVSQEAAAQIGSQALLDSGAVYSLGDLLHATIVASANDAACALAEYIAGTETAFAEMMNARAAELGLENTYYTNATGLPDDAQYTTARDVATLSVEMCRHPDYFTHASVWMDTLTHPSGRVTDLTNTNRLVRFYEGCDGLKTGSADASRYCLSATAQKDGLRLIAVVLGAETSQKRFDEARAMLDYGFANYKRVTVLTKGDRLGQRVPVHLGMADEVEVAVGTGMSMLLRPGQEKQLSLEVELPAEVPAPINAGDTLGMIRVKLDGSVIARLPAVAAEDVGMPGLLEGFLRVLNNWR
ncbi:MAG: D-alanyl-D-alanine carboxypeptidase [Clostridiales bacterium]|nr:D-alanyl-D-alanine carboxypeptidase [Clostridiales bacterium]